MSIPGISVLLPVYNARPYLFQAVESVLRQSHGDFELIIIDDGSDDGSKGIVCAFAERDSRVRVVTRENRGLVATLNEGLGMARGEYIARMDADDVSLSDRFASQLSFLLENPGIGVVGGQVELTDPDGAILLKWSLPTTHEEIDSALMAGFGGVIIHPAAMIRKDCLKAVGGYRPASWPAEDIDLFLRLAEITRLANLDQLILQYRQHPQSIGHLKACQQREAVQRAISDAKSRRGIELNGSRQGAANETLSQPVANHLKWGWWALQSGNIRAARKQAWRALKLRPWHLDTWRLAYCSARGH